MHTCSYLYTETVSFSLKNRNIFRLFKIRMWSLPFSLYIALSSVTSAAGWIPVFGYVGGEVNVSCPYGQGYESYEKYLCRNDCGDADVLITTGTTKDRYSIHDNTGKRVFTATISALRSSDAGKYWCGVSRTGKDIYTEVNLKVEKDSCCDRSTKVLSHEEVPTSLSCPYESDDQNNVKYICRGNQPSTCLQQALIISNNTQSGQFRLDDDKISRKFTVTITNLKQNDSGPYLCGVHRNSGLDVFSAVELEVKEWCCVKLNKLNGTAGRLLTMQCPYPPQHKNNRKFLCKGDRRNNCADMVTSQSRFTLQENVSLGSFLVMITELKEEDAGTYWCGSDSQWSAGNYTKIQLSVVSPQQTSTVTSSTIVKQPVVSQSTHIPGEHIKDKTVLYSVIFVVLIVLLILTVALVLVYKYKSHKARGTGVNMERNKTKTAQADEVISVTDIYENQDVVACSKECTSKPKSTYDDAGEDESDYQNFSTTEDIYCNQIYIHAKK